MYLEQFIVVTFYPENKNQIVLLACAHQLFTNYPYLLLISQEVIGCQHHHYYHVDDM